MPLSFELRDLMATGPSDFRWWDPQIGTEHFERTWEGTVLVAGRSVRIRHGIGRRRAYGRERVHSVTWLDGQPTVEGVAPDDYDELHALISAVKRPDKKLARAHSELPEGYEAFDIVNHREEIDARYSRFGLAVKIREDDVASWARLALLRARDLGRLPAGSPTARPRPPQGLRREPTPPRAFDAIDGDRKLAVVRELITFEIEERGPLQRSTQPLVEGDDEADRLAHEDDFAFLLAVIFDQGVRAERAWRAPLDLRDRLGYLDPARIVAKPEEVAAAIRRPRALHRFVNTVPRWVVSAADRVLSEYDGDAGNIWRGSPTAVQVRDRLDAFPGISQKKAAMTVMLLWRNRDVPIDGMDGCDVAVDIHLRRVFLRTGLAERDEPSHLIRIARDLYPTLPGALDPPAWAIGREWCHASVPECPECRLTDVCPKLVARAATVSGP